MAMHGDLSREARERAARTVEVADVFAAHAAQIVAALSSVPPTHVLAAVVDVSHEFFGTHEVDRSELVARIPELEGVDGWAMVFSPGVGVEDVRRRAAGMADIARKRMELIDRITARRAAD